MGIINNELDYSEKLKSSGIFISDIKADLYEVFAKSR